MEYTVIWNHHMQPRMKWTILWNRHKPPQMEQAIIWNCQYQLSCITIYGTCHAGFSDGAAGAVPVDWRGSATDHPWRVQGLRGRLDWPDGHPVQRKQRPRIRIPGRIHQRPQWVVDCVALNKRSPFACICDHLCGHVWIILRESAWVLRMNFLTNVILVCK